MVTIEQLKVYGADTAQGVMRCMGNESFYLRMVGLLSKDQNYEALKAALARHDLKAGFEAAHALKGVLANLALTPALKPVSEITELLRPYAKEDFISPPAAEPDCSPLLAEIGQEMGKLQVMLQ